MLIQTTIIDNQVQIAVAGDIHSNEADELREFLFSHIEAGKTSLIIDLSKLEYLNSDGIGTLVGVQKHLRAKGGGVIITGLRGKIKDQFEMFRLNSFFEIR